MRLCGLECDHTIAAHSLPLPVSPCGPPDFGNLNDTSCLPFKVLHILMVLSLLADASKCPSSPKSFLTSTSVDSFSKQ